MTTPTATMMNSRTTANQFWERRCAVRRVSIMASEYRLERWPGLIGEFAVIVGLIVVAI
jgi:hypothetical protein